MGGLWLSAQGRGLEVESQRISPMGFLCWPSSISARLAQLIFLQCPLLGAFLQSSANSFCTQWVVVGIID